MASMIAIENEVFVGCAGESVLADVENSEAKFTVGVNS
jgi:hypothetical protein